MAVSDLWHRTLVYFGMADEADDYDDDYDEELERRYERERDRQSPAHDDLFADEPPRGRPAPMRSVDSRPRPSEVHLVVPKSFNDAQQIADKFKAAVPVILNLQSAETDLAKRLRLTPLQTDFALALAADPKGNQTRAAARWISLMRPPATRPKG